MPKPMAHRAGSLVFQPIFNWLAALVLGLVWSASANAQEDHAMLLEAANAGRLEVVRTLIADGAAVDSRDRSGRTPLLLATRADHVEVAKALIDAGADVNAKDDIQDTPLLYAGAEGRDAILQAILATGKADLRDTNRYGGTALIPAAHHGHPTTVRILLNTDIDIDHVNKLGWTALLEAVILGDGGPIYQEIVGFLVEAGARDIADNDGKTPLDHAIARGFKEIAARLEAGPRK
ncbi:MAG: ankyrin repeat domain-containing protein [Pseudaminobacter sp.]